MAKEIFKNVPNQIKNKTYLVGGAVRDLILGLEPKDYDFVVVGSSEAEMLSLGFQKVGKDFPVFLHPKTGEEFALARKERSIGKGYADFVFETEGVTLKDDLSRRDLTINAIAMDSNGNIIDPFGGKKDLEEGILRATSEAFEEDPVRVLRTLRFATKYGFRISNSTIKTIKQMANKGLLKALKKERVWIEVEKVMKVKNPEVFFDLLNQLDLLKEIFPVLEEMKNTPQNTKHHAEGNVFNHSLLVLHDVAKKSNVLAVRMGALFHDIGKPFSYKKYGNLYSHTKEEMINKGLSMLDNSISMPSRVRSTIFKAALNHHKFHDFFDKEHMKVSKKSIDLILSFKSEEEFLNFVQICKADQTGRIISEHNFTYSEALFIKILGKDNIFSDIEFEIPNDTSCNLNFFRDLYNGLKKVSIKDFIKENPNAKVEHIKQVLLKRRKEVFFRTIKNCL